MKYCLTLLFMIMLLTGSNIARGQDFGPQHPNDTVKLQELMDHVSRHYFSKGNNVELYAKQGIELAKKLRDSAALMEFYRMAGIIYYFDGRYDEALQSYLHSAEISKATGNKAGEASAYNEIGNLYRKHNKLLEAQQILEKAYTISLSLKDTSNMAKSLNNLGVVHETANDLNKAIANYQQALSLYITIKDSTGQSYCFENIGGVYLMKNDFDMAETYLFKSLRIRQAIPIMQATAISYHYLGELYFKKGHIARSNIMFDSCLTIGLQIGYPDIVQRAYYSLANNYKTIRDFSKALTYYEKATFLKDSLFNAEKSRQLIEMQTKYDVNSKTQENLLLKKSNELNEEELRNRNLIIVIVSLVFISLAIGGTVIYRRRQQNQAIQTRLKIQKAEQQQRIRISHDLHDHVGAQLSYVVSNLDIAGREISSSHLDPKRLQAITEMSKQAISTLRETVWALNNESISAEAFADKLKAYIRKMTDLTEHIQVEFHEEISINNLLLPNTALHLFRICQESFSNALKHSGCSMISIEIRSNDKEVFYFRLSDNGIGFDMETARLKGHYGLENMKHRAGEVGATYHINSQKDKGTNIELLLLKNTTYA